MTRVRTSLFLAALMLLRAAVAMSDTTWYVNGLTGSDSNNCRTPTAACHTIGHAISLAASGDSVMVAAATYAEHLSIAVSLNLIGASASSTIIDGGGAKYATVVWISAGAHVNLANFTVRGGHAELRGGGIYNLGTLALMDSMVTGNIAGVGACGSLCGALGGGIYNYSGATMTISDTTIAGNSVSLSCTRGGCFVRGGGILNAGMLTLINSTVSGNTAQYTFNGILAAAHGGGLDNSGTVDIDSSTISGNTATDAGGGGISNGSTAVIQNSVLASNSGGNCSGRITSSIYTLSSDTTCVLAGSGDLNNVNPKLGTLGNYGGPTQTIPLLSGSPAIDAGDPSGCTDSQGHLLTTDQRGYPRPDKEDKGGCDRGAYESQSD